MELDQLSSDSIEFQLLGLTLRAQRPCDPALENQELGGVSSRKKQPDGRSDSQNESVGSATAVLLFDPSRQPRDRKSHPDHTASAGNFLRHQIAVDENKASGRNRHCPDRRKASSLGLEQARSSIHDDHAFNSVELVRARGNAVTEGPFGKGRSERLHIR
jgi:hypothetical protein